MMIRPSLGLSSPAIRLSRVVLPEPLGPISARNSPSGTSRLRSLSTSICSLPRTKNLWTSSTRTMAPVDILSPLSDRIQSPGWMRQKASLLVHFVEIDNDAHVRLQIKAFLVLGHGDLNPDRNRALAAVGIGHQTGHLPFVTRRVDLAERLKILVRLRHDHALLAG